MPVQGNMHPILVTGPAAAEPPQRPPPGDPRGAPSRQRLLEAHGLAVVKQIGKGAFGRAILVAGVGAAAGQFVVKEVKVGHLCPTERDLARMEIKVLRSLDHPNVVRYIDHFEGNGRLFIVMEYADSGDLGSVIHATQAPMPEVQATDYFVQICRALQHLHAKQILHRDLKPSNVFLSQNKKVVKLGDFGISTILRGSQALAKTQCGTPYYFSPEVCQKKPYDHKSDVWALGCLLYEMLALRRPFAGSTLPHLMLAICKGRYTPPPAHYSGELLQLVARLLEHEPSRRPSTAAILDLPFLRRHGDALPLPTAGPPVVLPSRIPAAPAVVSPAVAEGPAPADAKPRGGAAAADAMATPRAPPPRGASPAGRAQPPPPPPPTRPKSAPRSRAAGPVPPPLEAKGGRGGRRASRLFLSPASSPRVAARQPTTGLAVEVTRRALSPVPTNVAVGSKASPKVLPAASDSPSSAATTAAPRVTAGKENRRPVRTFSLGKAPAFASRKSGPTPPGQARACAVAEAPLPVGGPMRQLLTLRTKSGLSLSGSLPSSQRAGPGPPGRRSATPPSQRPPRAESPGTPGCLNRAFVRSAVSVAAARAPCLVTAAPPNNVVVMVRKSPGRPSRPGEGLRSKLEKALALLQADYRPPNADAAAPPAAPSPRQSGLHGGRAVRAGPAAAAPTPVPPGNDAEEDAECLQAMELIGRALRPSEPVS